MVVGHWIGGNRKLNGHWQSNKRKGLYNAWKSNQKIVSLMGKSNSTLIYSSVKEEEGDNIMYTMKAEGPRSNSAWTYTDIGVASMVTNLIGSKGDDMKYLYDGKTKLGTGGNYVFGYQISAYVLATAGTKKTWDEPNGGYDSKWNWYTSSSEPGFLPESWSSYQACYLDQVELNSDIGKAYRELPLYVKHSQEQKGNIEYIGETSPGSIGNKLMNRSNSKESLVLPFTEPWKGDPDFVPGEAKRIPGTTTPSGLGWSVALNKDDFELDNGLRIPEIGRTIVMLGCSYSDTPGNIAYFVTPSIYKTIDGVGYILATLKKA